MMFRCTNHITPCSSLFFRATAASHRHRHTLLTTASSTQPLSPSTAAAQHTNTDPLKGSSLVFVASVWPEVSSSAAGVRTFDLISHVRKTHNAQVTFVSTAQKEGNIHAQRLEEELDVTTIECLPNRETQFTAILEQAQPRIVVFDRFYMEEAFSFRTRAVVPNALRILDMQDVHFLRAARQRLAAAGEVDMHQILDARPDADNEDVLRELASIHRSDLTLVCSPVELDMLQTTYGIPSHKLVLAPFFPPPSPHIHDPPSFTTRRHFLMIGNFKHPPNMDAVRWTVKEIWPLIASQLPDAELHIYGAYPPNGAGDIHRPKQRVFLKGFTPTLDCMLQYRVCLAPLRYGAGLKGKIVDAWWHGLPVCTTPIGSEGMIDIYPSSGSTSSSSSSSTMDNEEWAWGGTWRATNVGDIANEAVGLYSDQFRWTKCQRRGFKLLDRLYDREKGLKRIDVAVERAVRDVKERRDKDFVGSMLWREERRSTEFFSRWLEVKEQLKTTQ